jgi:hypothetical protein
MENELIQSEQNGLIERQVQSVVDFLEQVGLPSDNIIADSEQRKVINTNLPQFIYNLPADIKKDARYLSKFAVGAGFGLFDYALNSIWNEVVIALRSKAIAYGLDIFFDKAVGGPSRSSYQKEEDLAGLKDIVLLTTCKKLELISDTTYKKLAHILDMRNDIGISHPTNATINAYELMGWLQTCIQEVLMDKPSEAAIRVKSFIDNLKEYGEVLNEEKITSILPEMQSLAMHHCDSIIRTLFGLYVARDTDVTVIKNISLIAPAVWPLTSDEERDRLGIMLAGYKNNLHKEKYSKGEQFFTVVKGNNYRTITERVIILDKLANRLKDAHYAYDNYFHEALVMEEIMTYVEKASDIPAQVATNLIRSIVLCRIGRGLSYQGGVSPKGKVYYDMFFKLLGSDYVPHVISELTQIEAQRKLEKPIAREACIEMLKNLKEKVVNDRYREGLDYLIANLPKGATIIYDSNFRKISSPFLKW